MQNERYNQIYQAMMTKTDEELLQIWQENDHISWHDEVFDVIAEILEERIGELPPQNNAILTEEQKNEQKNKEVEIETDVFGDPNNQPVFYNPLEILKLDKWLRWASYLIVVSTFFSNFRALYQEAQYIAHVFTNPNNGDFLFLLITSIMVIILTLGSCALLYFALYALRLILKILMQMEFTSRGVKLP